MDDKSTQHPTWQPMHDIWWSTGYCVRPIKKRRVYYKTRSCDNRLNSHWLKNTWYCHGGKPKPWNYGATPLHSPLSLYTKPEGPPIAISHGATFGWVWRALTFMVTTLWIVHKAALRKHTKVMKHKVNYSLTN